VSLFVAPDQKILMLATAGIQPGVGRPRVDYVELQRRIHTDVLDYSQYNRRGLGSVLRYLETQLHSDLYLTLLGWLSQRKYKSVFALSERVGIPFASLHRALPRTRPFISMFTCWSARQEKVITRLNLFLGMDLIIVKCQAMRENFLALGARPNRVRVIPFGVDHRYFSPLPTVPQRKGLILAVGEVRTRDYASLFQAVDGLPVDVLVAASGSWYARTKQTKVQVQPPRNVVVSGHFGPEELRRLYAQSQFVVLPITDVPFSAGVTSLLEAMSMERAVIVTRSRGIMDYVEDGVTALVVSPGNAAELRRAIVFLLAHPEQARRLGRNARQRIEQELNLDLYVDRIAETLSAFDRVPTAV
jgi:glycosyltransferase involved in cell wall biosynthesis